MKIDDAMFDSTACSRLVTATVPSKNEAALPTSDSAKDIMNEPIVDIIADAKALPKPSFLLVLASTFVHTLRGALATGCTTL
jgi:hypothetical protein